MALILYTDFFLVKNPCSSVLSVRSVYFACHCERFLRSNLLADEGIACPPEGRLALA